MALLRRILLALCVSLAPGLASVQALAQAPAPAPPAPAEAEAPSLFAWGEAHPDCGEWSDLCQACLRVGTEVHCSTPGIACTPVAPVCRAPVPKPASTPVPAPAPAQKPD